MKNDAISAMVVEDNHEARLLLEKHLAVYPDIHLVASAGTVDEATLAFIKHRPGMVFLDVELEDRTGFEFLDNIREIAGDLIVIFTTAFDHYAVEAIKHSAFDYLLKPIDPEELDSSVQKFRSRETSHPFDKHLDMLHSGLKHKQLKLNKKHGFVVVDPLEIIYCKADWNYTEIFLIDGISHTITENIGSFMERLPPEDFIRANRSLILNLNFLKQVDKVKRICILKSGNEEISLTLSTAKIRKLERLLDGRTGKK
jgi:two-component system, LytTR family, response regulator